LLLLCLSSPRSLTRRFFHSFPTRRSSDLVILGNQMFHHKDKFLKDEFGVTLTERTTKEWQDDEGNWYSEEVETPIPNPDFVEEEGYEARSERPEWNVVGLMGQVFTRIDSTVSVNDYIKPNKGVGT